MFYHKYGRQKKARDDIHQGISPLRSTTSDWQVKTFCGERST